MLDFIAFLKSRGITFKIDGDRLIALGPTGSLTPDEVQRIREEKPAIMRIVADGTSIDHARGPAHAPAPDRAHEDLREEFRPEIERLTSAAVNVFRRAGGKDPAEIFCRWCETIKLNLPNLNTDDRAMVAFRAMGAAICALNGAERIAAEDSYRRMEEAWDKRIGKR